VCKVVTSGRCSYHSLKQALLDMHSRQPNKSRFGAILRWDTR
jgi:hypothetical protein